MSLGVRSSDKVKQIACFRSTMTGASAEETYRLGMTYNWALDLSGGSWRLCWEDPNPQFIWNNWPECLHVASLFARASSQHGSLRLITLLTSQGSSESVYGNQEEASRPCHLASEFSWYHFCQVVTSMLYSRGGDIDPSSQFKGRMLKNFVAI